MESEVSRAQMASQAVGVAEGIGRSVAAAARMGTVAVEGGDMYAGEQVEGRKSGMRALYNLFKLCYWNAMFVVVIVSDIGGIACDVKVSGGSVGGDSFCGSSVSGDSVSGGSVGGSIRRENAHGCSASGGHVSSVRGCSASGGHVSGVRGCSASGCHVSGGNVSGGNVSDVRGCCASGGHVSGGHVGGGNVSDVRGCSASGGHVSGGHVGGGNVSDVRGCGASGGHVSGGNVSDVRGCSAGGGHVSGGNASYVRGCSASGGHVSGGNVSDVRGCSASGGHVSGGNVSDVRGCSASGGHVGGGNVSDVSVRGDRFSAGSGGRCTVFCHGSCSGTHGSQLTVACLSWLFHACHYIIRTRGMYTADKVSTHTRQSWCARGHLQQTVCVGDAESAGAQEESAAAPPAGQISRRSHSRYSKLSM